MNACRDFDLSWRAVGTAYRATAGQILMDRRTANERRDDADVARLDEINTVIKVANIFGETVSAVMGNMNSLNQNVAKWQAQVNPLVAEVSQETGKVEVGGGDIGGVDTQRTVANLGGMAEPAANIGGALIALGAALLERRSLDEPQGWS